MIATKAYTLNREKHTYRHHFYTSIFYAVSHLILHTYCSFFCQVRHSYTIQLYFPDTSYTLSSRPQKQRSKILQKHLSHQPSLTKKATKKRAKVPKNPPRSLNLNTTNQSSWETQTRLCVKR